METYLILFIQKKKSPVSNERSKAARCMTHLLLRALQAGAGAFASLSAGRPEPTFSVGDQVFA